MLLAVAGCEKIPETPVVETKLDVVLLTENITVPYKYKSEIDVRIDNAKDKFTSVKFSGLPNLVQAEFVNSTFGHGQIVILSLLEKDADFDLKLSFENAGMTCEKTLKVKILGPKDISFESGETKLTYEILEYERVFDIPVLSESDDIRVSSNFDEDKNVLDYEILKNRGINVIRFLLRENPTAETRKISIDISVPGSTQTLSISIRQKGAREKDSMRELLKAFFEGTKGKTNWLNIHKWNTDNPINEWYGVSSVFIEELLFKGKTMETYVGLTDLWNIDLNWNYLAGEIPQIFWDNFKYIGYFDINGTHLDAPLESIPETVWHENLMGLRIGSINILQGSLERIYDCPNLQAVYISQNKTEIDFHLDDRLINLRNLQELYLLGVKTSGYIPQNIGELKHLKDFWCMNIGGTFPESMYELENLENFVISGDISGTLSPKVANWKNLEEFQLIKTKMSGKIPEEFGTLPKLNRLELNANHFDLETVPEFYRYWPPQNGNWTHGAFDSYWPAYWQYNEKNEGYNAGTPKWAQEKTGNPDIHHYLEHPLMDYPYAKDLEFPAYEYYWNGSAWMHPKYEYPARYYHKVGDKWIYDPEWDWNEIVVPITRVIWEE